MDRSGWVVLLTVLIGIYGPLSNTASTTIPTEINTMSLTGTSILRERPVARTPVSRPLPGAKFEHLKHGLVEVQTVEDDTVVFKRPGPSSKHGYINTRQQPLSQFRAQTVDVS